MTEEDTTTQPEQDVPTQPYQYVSTQPEQGVAQTPAVMQSLYPGATTILPDATAGWSITHDASSWAVVQYIEQPDLDVPYFIEGRYWFHHGRHDCPPDVAGRLLAQPGFLFVRDIPAPSTGTP